MPKLWGCLKKGCVFGLALGLVLALIFWIWIRVGFEGPALPPEPLPREGIVDLHAHVAGVGAGGSGCFVSEELRSSFKMKAYLRAFGIDEGLLQRKGDALVVETLAQRLQQSEHVKAAVVLALDGVIGPDGKLDRARTELYVPNEFVYEQTRAHPHLRFGASIHPQRPDALSRLERVHGQGAALVKWLPSVQLFDPADPGYTDFYLKLVELNLPLLSHTGHERAFTRADHALGDPQRLELALSLGVTVIAAHAASTGRNEGEENPARLLRLVERYPNLYADISSLTQLNKLGYLNRFLKDPHLIERLVYGSDFPLIATPLVSARYFPLQLGRADMRRIQSVENVWDRDVRLKQALGVPSAVFARSEMLLSSQPAQD